MPLHGLATSHGITLLESRGFNLSRRASSRWQASQLPSMDPYMAMAARNCSVLPAPTRRSQCLAYRQMLMQRAFKATDEDQWVRLQRWHFTEWPFWQMKHAHALTRPLHGDIRLCSGLLGQYVLNLVLHTICADVPLAPCAAQ